MEQLSKTPKIKVLVAEDQPHTRLGIIAHLASYKDFEILPSGATDREHAMQLPDNVVEAVKMVKLCKPDVVVMDIKWGSDDIAGIKASRQIKDELPDTKVILCTQYCRRETVASAVIEGRVDGYVLKDEASPLPSAIRTVFLKGLPFFVPEVVECLLAVIRTPRHANPPISEPLSDDELKILKRIAQGESNKSIANNLSFTDTTIKNKIHFLYEKLGVSDDATKEKIEPRVMAVLKGLERGDVNLSDLVPYHPR